MRYILQWAGSAAALLGLAHSLPGIRVASFNTALVVALVYGLLVTLVNVLLIPFAYTLFIWVPRTIWNLGCLLVVNAAVLLAISYYVRGFEIKDFQTAAIAAVALAIASWLLGKMFASS